MCYRSLIHVICTGPWKTEKIWILLNTEHNYMPTNLYTPPVKAMNLLPAEDIVTTFFQTNLGSKHIVIFMVLSIIGWYFCRSPCRALQNKDYAHNTKLCKEKTARKICKSICTPFEDRYEIQDSFSADCLYIIYTYDRPFCYTITEYTCTCDKTVQHYTAKILFSFSGSNTHPTNYIIVRCMTMYYVYTCSS